MSDLTRLLSVDDLCELFPHKRNTFYSWRARGKGPRSLKIGGRVCYREADVIAWLEAEREKDAARDGAA